LQGYVIDHLKISPAGAASVTVPRTAINDLHLADDQVSAVVGTPGRLDTVVAWAEFIEQAEGGYRVHLRSKGPIINGLAKEHNGGGHPLASGAKAANFDEIIQIETQLDQLVRDFSTTRK
jgi:bifunctional oligoribonuclease and PAP phosphatase NrnA